MFFWSLVGVVDVASCRALLNSEWATEAEQWTSDVQIEHFHVFEHIEYEYTPVFGHMFEYKCSYDFLVVVITWKVS